MKIVFLDVDGVINSLTYYKSRGKEKRVKFDEIDETRLPLLNQIIKQTGASIVLSSTWRVLDDVNYPESQLMYQYLEDTLGKYGLEIMSKTPNLGQNRPLEIKTWLDNRIDKNEMRFVSLDDDFNYEDYEEYGIENNLVKTTFYGEHGGLQQEHVDKAIKILNS